MILLVQKKLSYQQFIAIKKFLGISGMGLGFSEKENELVWYVLFIIFVPYAMLPLPLRWCMIFGCLSALCHIIILIVDGVTKNVKYFLFLFIFS